MENEAPGINVEIQGNIQLLNNEQPQGISSDQYNQKPKDKESSLDEPISVTLLRDLKMIGIKLKYVLLPSSKEDKGKQLRNCNIFFTQQLNDYQIFQGDLWGPLLLCLCLSITLSISTSGQAETVFAIVFVVVWIGAAVVTLNAKLLGGKISFFQSVCVLGYCIFPINLVSFIAIFLSKDSAVLFIIKSLLCAFAFIWATRSSVPFMSTLVSEEKKILGVYPVLLFYLFLSWFALVA